MPRTASWVSTTPLGSPVDPLVATTSASPASTGRAAGEAVLARRRGRRSAPTARWPSAARPRAGGGSRRSTGSAASPRSHTRRSASTNAGPPGRSRATSRHATVLIVPARHGAHDGRAHEPLDPRRPAAHAAGGGRAGRPRRRVRRRATARCAWWRVGAGARRQPRPAGRRELRQRLQRRRARHRRRPGRAGAPGGLGRWPRREP